MLEQKQLDDLLQLPIEERRRVISLLKASLNERSEVVEGESDSSGPSPSARWLLSLAGRYSSKETDTSANADEIMRAEIDRRSGFTIKK